MNIGKFKVVWSIDSIDEPLETSLDNLNQVIGALSAIRDMNDAKLISVSQL